MTNKSLYLIIHIVINSHLIFSCFAQDTHACGRNEEFMTCGPLCEPSCKNVIENTPCDQKQRDECTKGCFCRRGFFRDSFGNCVQEEECFSRKDLTQDRRACGRNEDFMTCGPICEPSCKNVIEDTPCEQRQRDECTKGCFCKRGFFRDSFGNCVQPTECFSRKDLAQGMKACGMNEEFMTCGPICEPSCKNVIEDTPCDQKQRDECTKGCFCRQGFFRDSFGNCIQSTECLLENDNRVCGSLEVFDKCNANCQVTCENHGNFVPCPTKCQPGCLCAQGLVRNEEGKCIPPEFCQKMLPHPPECKSPLEDFHYCFAGCEPTCKNPEVATDCANNCKAGCMCKEGLVRSDTGFCILPQMCPEYFDYEAEFCTGPHEEYKCGFCDLKCSTLEMPCPFFSLSCTKKCYCENGYARDHRNICVPIRKCPRSSNFFNYIFDFVLH